ncbi:MAG: transcriptional regulatory protein LysR family, partial [Marmoricola sp.]|nr:transcriptional regulatory protein LysR family [Marmoricola sp.]
LARPRFDPAVLASRVVQREALRVVVPAGHRLASLGRAIHRDDLVDEPLIMHSAAEAQYLHELVLSVVPISGRRVVHTVSQLLTMVSLVSAGRGIAFIPDSATRLGIDGIEYLPLDVRPQPSVELHLLWLKESRNPALWRVLDILDDSPAG